MKCLFIMYRFLRKKNLSFKKILLFYYSYVGVYIFDIIKNFRKFKDLFIY